MRIMIVDDSIVFRSQIKSALDGIDGIIVAQTAANGKIALDKLEQNPVDVLILDLEMPEMDGMAVLEEMKKRNLSQKVIVFAATTGSGIDLLFSALNAGASDFIAKPHSTGSLEQALDGIKRELIPKILQFQKKYMSGKLTTNMQNSVTVNESNNKKEMTRPQYIPSNISLFKPRAIGIGSSTGGPAALNSIFSKFQRNPINIPIFIAQHMPPKFTEHLAKDLEKFSGHHAKEAIDGEVVRAGNIYIAPGDFHMRVEKAADGLHPIIRLDQTPKRNSVRPAVDNLFESLASFYGENCAAFVLTGMGEDGLLGAKSIKAVSGKIVIQDEETSVVWGMPGSIFAANAFDEMRSLDQCAELLIEMSH